MLKIFYLSIAILVVTYCRRALLWTLLGLSCFAREFQDMDIDVILERKSRVLKEERTAKVMSIAA